MSRQDEDDAWRSIVENYGERAEIDPAPPVAEPEPEPATAGPDRLERLEAEVYALRRELDALKAELGQ